MQNSVLLDVTRTAIDKGLFYPHFQPIVDKGDVVMYECLARIKGHEHLSPTLFIPIIKELGYYKDFTKIIIEKSFQKLKKVENTFSINIGICDITDKDIIKFLLFKIDEYDVAKKLIIELLENNLVFDYENILCDLNKIRKLGVRVAMDDFGDGYGDYSRLLIVKPDFIKISKTMVKDIKQDDRLRIIINSVAKMAKELKIKVVAEYISDEKVFEIVKNKNVDYFQGYYIGKPNKRLINENSCS